MTTTPALCRRDFIIAAGSVALAAAVPHPAIAAADPIGLRLIAKPGRVPIVGSPHPETAVWGYGGTVPGPEIRLSQGERLRAVVENRLKEGTTVHWHGIRVPNAMDGVPRLTQDTIQPGASFTYEFDLPDAGTYWYHTHDNSPEQIGRGLYGPLIVEEPEPPKVDRDVVWVLGDFRLLRDASIAGGFENRMEMAMAGRIGNTVTVNGKVAKDFTVRAGERIRLRLINAAAARVFALEFRGHRPFVIAYDGQPVEPHEPEDEQVVLGPAMRTDLILDLTGKPRDRLPIIDPFYDNLTYRLVTIAYSDETPLPRRTAEDIARLPPNTMPEPDLAAAERHEIVLEGGMMGGGSQGGMMGGGMMGMMRGSAMWSINGVAAMAHDLMPSIKLRRGATALLAIRNETAWYHPVHLHGHSFRVVTRNGKPTRYREWRDTVLVPPREQAEIAFVADNPGDWMIHCHIPDHQEGGMMTVIRVA
ncbi:MAG: multicopper oxidase family protein [Proteobacteria bacterium]|nr:multicopper oxidase family protein [Pseudomonadota bacterium]MBI3498577.1 multicopper oxidase family protein [Pseudomonadota bacterium]